MAWIESHEEIGDHWKTHELAKRLNCGISAAVGTVHLLWHYTLRNAWKTGDLSKHSPIVIARACWFQGLPETLISALQASKWLDGMKVHDWLKYAKEIIYQRDYNERRKEQRRKNLTAVHTADLQLYVQRKKPATLPYPTLPNQTKDKDIPLTPKGGKLLGFEDFWKNYPRKVGKGAAERAWVKLRPAADLQAAISRAVVAQRGSKDWLKDSGQFVPHPATWLNQRRWEDELTGNTKRSSSGWDRIMGGAPSPVPREPSMGGLPEL